MYHIHSKFSNSICISFSIIKEIRRAYLEKKMCIVISTKAMILTNNISFSKVFTGVSR